MRGKRKELTTFDVNTNEMRFECHMRNSTERNTQRKNSRTSSNEDKVEIQGIMSECKVGNVDTKT